MLTIDGSIGEGGGQVLRSALTLSLVSGRAFRIVNVRSRRGRPGLQPQHLAAVRAAAEISGAHVTGAEVGGGELSFAPGPVRPGEYRFAIGTAGSTTLVAQTVLPALLTSARASLLDLEGGTHNPQAPSYEFLAMAYRPLLERMGPRLRIELLRPGFYPAGGGRVRIRIEPAARLAPLEIERSGVLRRLSAAVLLCRLPAHIAERERAVLTAGLPLTDAAVAVERIGDSLSPGNAVTVLCEFEQIAEVFTAIGRRGVPAETVAAEAVRATQAYLASGVPVGPHLADQLLLPMALAGRGSFVTSAPSSHTLTNIRVIEMLLPLRIRCAALPSSDRWRIEVCQGVRSNDARVPGPGGASARAPSRDGSASGHPGSLTGLCPPHQSAISGDSTG
jgi:RNA 3'-terminal phosphate cyclase (ATP)